MVYLCHACEGLFDTLLFTKIPSARPITEHLLQSLVTGSVVREKNTWLPEQSACQVGREQERHRALTKGRIGSAE
jgi:hypothetical protein